MYTPPVTAAIVILKVGRASVIVGYMNRILRMITAEWIMGFTLLFLIFASYLSRFEPLEKLELITFDLRARMTAEETEAPVVIVTENASNRKELGSLPRPKSDYAILIAALSDKGASVVALERLFIAKDRGAALEEMDALIDSFNEMNDEKISTKKRNVFN